MSIELERPPADGDQIVAHFRTYDHDAMWATNWVDGPLGPDPAVPWTSTIIQGIVCCIDRGFSVYWLLELNCSAQAPYLATCSGSWTWPRTWIRSANAMDACSEFVAWARQIGDSRSQRR